MTVAKSITRYGVVLGFLSAVMIPAAHAAQVGKVIVDQASVHEYPQENSRVIAKVPKDEQVTVSNVPTQGFYKARVKSGQVGWISGNEIFVKGGGRGAAPARKGRTSYKPEDMRIQLMYGIDKLSYSGLSSVFTTTNLSGTSGAIEGQFRLKGDLFWAIRAEYHTGSQAAIAVDALTTQTITQSIIPVMIGANYTLKQWESFRVGAGLYLGMAVVSSTTIAWTDATEVEEVKYSSLDPCGALNVSGIYSFSDSFGAMLEAGYRYHKTGEFPSTTRFGGKDGFSINYSGITIRLGLELKL